MESGSSRDQDYAKVDEDAEEELNPESRDSVLTAENVERWKEGIDVEDALSRIKSFEDSLEKSKSDISVLQEGKSVHLLERLSLDSQLNARMEELAATNGSLESKLLVFTGFINELQAIMHDDSLSLLLKETLKNKLESLKGMNDIIILSLKHQFAINSGLERFPLNDVMDDITFPGPHSMAIVVVV